MATTAYDIIKRPIITEQSMEQGLAASREFRKLCMALVFTSSSFRPSTTRMFPAAALADRADLRASRRVFLFRLER